MAPTSTGASEPRWLDDTEQQAWRRVVFGMRRLMVALDHDLKNNGINNDDYGVMVALSEADDDRMRMAELADLTAQSRSRLSHHIARLERRDLVGRQPCADDRRGQYAVLTPAGRELLESTAPLHVESVRRHLLDHLSASELATLADVFARVDDALGPCPDN